MTPRILAAALTAALTTLTVGTVLAASPQRETRGNLVLDGVPAHSVTATVNFDRWMSGRAASFQDFLPDGSLLLSTRAGDAEQIHRVAAPFAIPEALTFAADPAANASASAAVTPLSFVFSRDQGGNENAQLFLQQGVNRATRMLTDGRSRHGNVVWAHDGRRIAFQSNARDGAHQDIYLSRTDVVVAPQLILAAQEQTWQPLDWSPDDQKLLLLDYKSVSEAYLWVVEIATGKTTAINLGGNPSTAASPRSGIGGARFSVDGRGVWFTADAGGEYRQLRYVGLDGSDARSLTSDVPWDVDDFDCSADGRYLAYTVNADGYSKLHLIDLVAQKNTEIFGLPRGVITNLRFEHKGTRLGLSVESAQSPRDVWTLDALSNVTTRWTQNTLNGVEPAKLVAAELIRYSTWDNSNGSRRRIPAFVYRPTISGKHPVLIDIHGGPEGQSRPGYSAWIQYVVNELGYVVIQPNVRGSTGYGRNFTNLDNGMLREDSVRDIGALLVWIGAQSNLDATAIVVMGGSYGGYMSLASMVAYSDRLRGGVDVVGISNFVTFLNNTSAYRRDLRRAEYGDERRYEMREYLQRISPLSRASLIKKPLLVVQGLNDPRVPASESEQMVAKLRANGGEVWYLAAKDEGHGFRKKTNRDFYLKTVATFLEKLKQTP